MTEAVELGEPSVMGSLVTLAMLILLQAVLGFDNLLYISLESKRAPEDKQSFVRKFGVGLAIVLRIGLLFALVALVGKLTKPFWVFGNEESLFAGRVNFHSLIVLLGGAFIIYTAIKEIFHMTHIGEHEHAADNSKKSVNSVIFLIVVMNLVFSFDSILSAMALSQYKVAGENGEILTRYNMWVMVVAIVISGLLMIWMADKVSNFLQKNRMYEVLGLFILFVVGIMLVTEGGHLAHLKVFGGYITPMTKSTFYFVIIVLAITDVVQSRYQKKLLAEKDHGNTKIAA
ncbi:MAG: TerC family protein [Verrucomicrobiales bacterium]|nr:TerC family protein [Verrucomicrobiales bacterium]